MRMAATDRFQQLLRNWSANAHVEARLPGGARNDVRAVRIGGRRYVARKSFRSEAAIAWEVDLLLHLQTCGLRVPRPLESKDGRLQVDGFVVLEWLDGVEPRTMRDWREAVRALDRLHAATRTWPQRPGFASTVELLTRQRGGDVDLAALPANLVSIVRAAWEPLRGMPTSVVHGDLHAGNIRISPEGTGLIDWDEARVDVSLLDLSDIPADPDRQVPVESLELIRNAGDAWETANAWALEPAYARRRLRMLEARSEDPMCKPPG